MRVNKKEQHVDMYTAMRMMEDVHPKIKAIIDQVNSSTRVDHKDKKMIENQLISMAATLNEAKNYELVIGHWRKESTYSVEREAVAAKKTIRNETIFTIVSNGRRKMWTAYVDLPIDVKI